MISLGLFDPLPTGNQPLGDYTKPFKATWRRSIARICGFKIGSVSATTKDLSVAEMAELFEYGLLRELREQGGGRLTWQGVITAMDWQHKGDTYTIDLNNMANAQRAIYRRVFDSLLADGSAESGAWTVYNGATVTQSTDWLTDGLYSCKIVVADTTIRGARISGAGYALTIVAGQAYAAGVSLYVPGGGSWRVSINRADNDQSLAYFSTNGTPGHYTVSLTIDKTNAYAGGVDFRITSESSAGTIYADNAYFKPADLDADTGWQIDPESIKVYGRKELIDLWGGLSYQAANARVASDLLANGWPQPDVATQGSTRMIATDPTEDKLDITFAGYWTTLNWLYGQRLTSGQSGSQVATLAALQSQYIVPGIIEANATTFAIDDATPQRLGDILKEIADAGEDTGSKWAVGVYEDRHLNYERVAAELSYYLQGGHLLNVSGGEIEPWLARPGWAEVLDLPISAASISGHVQHNPRWRYLEEVEMMPPDDQHADWWLNYSREEAK